VRQARARARRPSCSAAGRRDRVDDHLRVGDRGGRPLLSALFALGTTLGLVPVISHVVDTPDFAGQLAALIGLGVGIDYALIVVTRYRAEHARGLERDEALLVAIDTAGRTVFFAA